jgi:hypothetical protein
MTFDSVWSVQRNSPRGVPTHPRSLVINKFPVHVHNFPMWKGIEEFLLDAREELEQLGSRVIQTVDERVSTGYMDLIFSQRTLNLSYIDG